MKWSDHMKTKFNGFQLDVTQLLMNSKDAPALNFPQMKKLLLSKVSNSREIIEVERQLSLYKGSVFLDQD